MRLFDLVAQSPAALAIASTGGQPDFILPNATRIADALKQCPLRYVLSPAATDACWDTAIGDGDLLHRCLDLIRVPATTLWVEWGEPERKAVFARHGWTAGDGGADISGLLIRSDESGRRGIIHSIWADRRRPEQGADVSPFDIHFDLDEAPAGHPPTDGSILVRMPDRPDLNPLFAQARFCMSPGWQHYYARQGVAGDRATVINRMLSMVAGDFLLVLSLSLMLQARHGPVLKPSDLDRLNRRRIAAGRPPLLEHVEVHLPLLPAAASRPAGIGSARSTPRLHFVRGHLVRRNDNVFWRHGHLRGSAARGAARPRTVILEGTG